MTDLLTYRRHRFDNNFQTLVLIIGMLALLAGLTVALGDMGWIVIFFGFSLILVSIIPNIGPAIFFKLNRATRISPKFNPAIYQMLVEISKQAGLTHTPKLYYLPSRIHNAFAMGTGRSASIGITAVMLDSFETREIAGILAHEVSHIRNKDTLVMGLANRFRRFCIFLSRVGILLLIVNLPLVLLGRDSISLLALLLMISAPTLAALLQLSLSRTREYAADATAAHITGDPEGLALALARLKAIHEQKPSGWQRIFLPTIKNQPTLLSTHPPTDDRIERLAKLAIAA